MVALARSLALPATVLLLWTSGGLLFQEGLAGREDAYSLVQDLLGAWLAYRVLHAVARLIIPAGSDAEASRLYSSFHRLVLFATCWWVGVQLLSRGAPDSETLRLWVIAGHLCLVLGGFGFLVRKQAILSLLPDLESPAYQRFRGLLSAIYLPLVYFSLIIAVLWVAGYQALAATFLARSWAIIGLLIAAFIAFAWLRDILRRSMDGDETRPQAETRMLAASEQLLGVSVLVLTAAAALSILGLWPVWNYLLDQDWIGIGKTRISGEAIWASIGILVAVLVLSRFVQAVLEYRVYPAVGVGAGEAYAFNRLLHYALVAVSVLLVLNNLGLSAENLALVAGGLSVGIGLGLQDVAKNIAGGIILLTTRQVRQGDVISVAGQMGTVREVNLRATVVTTGDNVDLLVPNSRLLEETVVNWTHSSSIVRAKVPFGVSFTADPQRVMALALEAAKQHPEVMSEPAPEAWLLRMGDNALEFELQVWVDIRLSVRPRVTTALYVDLLSRLQAEGIEVPFPQRDLHLRSGIPWDELLHALTDGRAPAGSAGNGQAGAPERDRSEAV
jgi:small-conductance mechanosensitive channel